MNLTLLIVIFFDTFHAGRNFTHSLEVKPMPLLVGGAIATVLGLLGLIVWWQAFVIILKGALPIMLLLGGGLAMYVGYDDIQDQLREDKKKQDEKLDKAREEIEQIRAKAELYREELERLKDGSLKSRENNS